MSVTTVTCPCLSFDCQKIVIVIDLVEAFLSHASQDRTIAGVYRKKLKQWHVNAFLAHEDIEGGQEWMKIIHERIQNCEVFLILLSKKYHRAKYTDQETGIAYAMNKTMIPISLDGTKPYGFMSKYQSIKGSYNPTTREVFRILKQIVNHNKIKRRIDQKLQNYFQLRKRGIRVDDMAKLMFIYKKLYEENYKLR